MKKIFAFILTLSALVTFGQEANKGFDYGIVSEGVYTNSFFEMKITFDPSWVVQSQEQVDQLVEKGQDLITDDEELKKSIEASSITTAYLLTIFKYEVGTAVASNPAFIAVAENVKSFPEIKSGEEYLLQVKELLAQSQLSYSFDKEIYEKKIGNLKFSVLEAEMDVYGSKIVQEYISVITDGFCLSYILTYTDDNEKKELYRIIDNIKLK